MLPSPLSWVGGKYRLRDKIIARIPEHRGYIEPFCGAAWVLFGLDPKASRFEVINDLDGELINFWRVLKHRPSEFSEAVSWLLPSRELWTKWAANLKSGICNLESEIDRAVAFYAVIKLGFGSRRLAATFGLSAKLPRTWWDEVRADVREIVRRLRTVWIEHLPWQKCIERFDARQNFFYLDPPYRNAQSRYAHTFTDDDHRSLAETLCRRVRAKWLLSYNNDPWLRRLYRGRGIKIEEVSAPYTIARTGFQRVRELLIRNYPAAP